MMLDMAARNGMRDDVPFKSEAEAEAMFNYDNLQQFLDLRDASLQVELIIKGVQNLHVDHSQTRARNLWDPSLLLSDLQLFVTSQ